MAEKNIELDSVEIAAAVFGNCDRNIRLLENEFSVTAVCRGTQLRLSGEPANVAAASRAVEGMLLLIENHTPLEDQTVRYCISLAHDGAEKRVRELTEDFVTATVKGRPIRPKTLGQKEYLNAIRNNAITFGVGPAGTGKTYLAVAMAVKAFKAKEVSRIVLTRPAVEAGEKLGFLPGDLQQKVDPYLRPLYDGLFDMLGAETYERLVEKQIIEVAPLAYMRGRTLDDSFIILDEAQNTTPEQMKMFLTRMGVGSKVVVTGDVTQIDLPERTHSGLVDALHVLKQVKGIAQCYFTEKDVVRHRLVQEIIKAYDRAAPTGLSSLMRFRSISASVEPVRSYSSASSRSSPSAKILTCMPIEAVSLDSSLSSMMRASLRVASRSAMRASTEACSSLAASYSAFSLKSP